MSNRRTRYQITTAEGDTLHALAYSTAWVRAQYPTAVAIEPWAAVKRRNAAHAGSWALDHDAIAEAVAFFSLKLPVDYVLLPGTSATSGSYALVPYGEAFERGGKVYNLRTATSAGTHWRHRIKLREGQSAAAASRALWHELTHAMQAERRVLKHIQAGETPRRVFDAWRRAPEQGYRSVAYRYKPVEVEAREHEAYADALPLVKSVATRTARPAARA